MMKIKIENEIKQEGNSSLSIPYIIILHLAGSTDLHVFNLCTSSPNLNVIFVLSIPYIIILHLAGS